MSAGFTEPPDQVYEKYGKKVYTNVIDALTHNASRKFTVSQVAFFARFFDDLPLDQQIGVYSLVRNEQLTFVGGSWTEADEAVTHYLQVIDDLTLGQDWMRKRFRECSTPRIAWQFNSLAHTTSFSSILAQSGYDMLFMFRMDRNEREQRRESQQLEFIWRSGGERLLVSIPYDSLPPQFNFDTNWYPISQEELDSGATKEFVRHVQRIARSSSTNHVYVLMGNDFCFRNADIHFHSIENLMTAVREYANTTSKTPMDIFYSSPSCYMKALYDSGRVWPSSSESFVSNSETSERDTFQSGFFTSRASLKHELRMGSSYLETAKQLAVLSGRFGRRKDPAVKHLRFLLSLGLQSKFVAGISSQAVSWELQQVLRTAMVPVVRAIALTFSCLAAQVEGQKFDAAVDVTWHSLLSGNNSRSSVCRDGNETRMIPGCLFPLFSSGEQEEIRIFNPLSRLAVQIIRLPVLTSDQTFIVMNWQGYDLQNQLLPIIHPQFISPSSASSSSQASNTDPPVDHQVARHELVFKAMLPAMGFTSFVIRKRLNDQKGRNPDPGIDDGSEAWIGNDFYQINYDPVTGGMRSLRLLSLNQSITFTNKWLDYESGDRSNHYTIDSRLKAGKDLSEGAKLIRVVRGSIVEEIHVLVSPLISHVIRVYRDREEIECEWIISPSSETKGNELFLRIQAEPLNSSFFTTDSNCKDPVKRFLNTTVRSDGQNAAEETAILATSLFPVNCFIAIQDENIALAIIPDRPEAGTSISAGRIDMLVHRSTANASRDSLVQEPLTDTEPFRGRHKIFLSTAGRVNQQVLKAEKSVLKTPMIFVRDKSSGPKVEPTALEFSCLNSAKIPSEINILSLESWNEGKALIRVESMDDYGSGNEVTFSLKDAFTCIKVLKGQEVTLTAATDFLEAKKKQFKWRERGFDETSAVPAASSEESSTEIKVRPGEIRTFILWLDE